MRRPSPLRPALHARAHGAQRRAGYDRAGPCSDERTPLRTTDFDIRTLGPAVALAAAFHLTPRWILEPALWTIGVGLALAFVAWFAATGVQLRRTHRAAVVAAAMPMPCPACGHTEHDYKWQGLWDGVDPATGHDVGGCFGYGICRACGAKWAQPDDRPPYVCPPEEWAREIDAPEARRAEELRRCTEHHARRTGPKPIDY